MKDTRTVKVWFKRASFALVMFVTLTGADSLAGSPSTVEIKEFKFAPPALTVPLGTTVTWVNQDEETHTVTSTTGTFGSAGLSNKDMFSQTFVKPGTYEYQCRLHPYMKATVIVK